MKTFIRSCSPTVALAAASMFSAPLVGQTFLYHTTPYTSPYPSCGGGTAIVSVAQRSVSSNSLPYDGRIVLGAQESRVLRQRVSVPLDRLVEPTTLAEWVQGSAGIVAPAAEPIVTSAMPNDAQGVGRANNPFVDDTRPEAKAAEPVAAAVDPFAIDGNASGATASESNADGGGKIPSKKLMGILGKVLSRSAPVPSLDSLKQAMPSMPGSGGGPPSGGLPGRPMALPPQGPPADSGGSGASDDPFAR